MPRTLIAREWNMMKVGDRKLIRTLDCYQIQSQVGKVRKKRPECRDWRWRTRRTDCGAVIVERIK